MNSSELLSNPYFYTAALSLLFSAWILGLFLARIRQSPIIAWFIGLLGGTVLLSGYELSLFFFSNRVVYDLAQCAFLGLVISVVICTFYFTIYFVDKSEWMSRTWMHGVIFSTACLLLFIGWHYPNSIVGGDFTKLVARPWGYDDLSKPTLAWMFIVWLQPLGLLPLYWLIRAYRAAKQKERRRQIAIVTTAIALPFFTGIITLEILPAVFGVTTPPLNVYANTALAGLIGLALYRYGTSAFDPMAIKNGIIQTMYNPALAVDTRDRVIYANPSAARMFGISEAGLLGLPIQQLILRSKNVAYNNEDIYSITDAKAVQSSGKTTPINMYASVFREKDGRIMGTIYVLADVSQLHELLDDAKRLGKELAKEKESIEKVVATRTKQLSEEKARLLASINSLRLGVVLTNKQGEIIYANNALLTIAKLKEQPATISGIQLGADAAQLQNLLDGALTKRRPRTNREILFGSRYVSVYVSPVSNDKGTVIGGIILLEDITEAKALQRSRDEFFAIASHELRTPLTAIRGYSSIITTKFRSDISDEVAHMITGMHDSSVKLIGIVNDFLDMSRLEQDKAQLRQAPFNIRDVLEKLSEMHQAFAAERGDDLQFVTNKSLPLAYGDATRCEQILSNLIGNAIKFTQNGTIRTEVTQTAKSLTITVSDTGVGIPARNQSLLFKKFQQAGDSIYTHDPTRGTGLGLYISRILAEKMGGKLELIESRENHGSSFALSIPIADSKS